MTTLLLLLTYICLLNLNDFIWGAMTESVAHISASGFCCRYPSSLSSHEGDILIGKDHFPPFVLLSNSCLDLELSIRSQSTSLPVAMSLEELPAIYSAMPLLADEPETSKSNRSDENSSSKVSMIHSIHFVAGCLIGNAHAILGFKRLYSYFYGMSTTNVLLYSIIWSLITSLSGYFLYNLVWTIIMQRAETSRKLRGLCKPHLLLQYEYATYLGIFIGFCLGCTAADVVYGMPWTCVAATVLMAVGWAGLMIWCAHRESSLHEHAGQGITLPLLVV